MLVTEDGFCSYYIARSINILDFSVLEEIVVRFEGKSDLLRGEIGESEIEDESECRGRMNRLWVVLPRYYAGISYTRYCWDWRFAKGPSSILAASDNKYIPPTKTCS